MWWWLSTLVALCLYALLRLLHLASPSLPPTLFVKSRHSHFVQALLASCPILREPYVPPVLWGKSGHIQTVVYAKIGRMRDPVPSGSRHTKIMQDGSTLTFDLYTPTAGAPTDGTNVMMVCPGFGSSSESSYIRALVTHAQACGYHLAVLNHLGCLFSLPLTAPRIFSYGGWEEFHIMRQEVEALYPQCRIIMVGLSMGANIVIKYLGENARHQRNVCGALSICQGYNINEAKHLLKGWQNLRRAYLYTMTANQRRLINHHSEVLFAEDVQQTFGFELNKVFAATTLEDLDHHFSCKLHGYTDVVEFYEQQSCSHYITNINIPLVLLNSEDDPIVPSQLLKHARNYAESHDEAVFITTSHGGHLGFFEHGYLKPHPTSWMDRFVCQLATAILDYTAQNTESSCLAAPLENTHFLSVKTKESEPVGNAQTSTKGNADLSTGEGTSVRHRSSQSQSSKVTLDLTEDEPINGEEGTSVSPSSSFLCADASGQLSSLAEEACFMLDDAAAAARMTTGVSDLKDVMS